MAGLSISRAWDETKQVVRRDGRLLTTIGLALFVLPGVIAEIASPAAPEGEMPKLGPWTIVTAVMLVIALAGQLAVIRLVSGSRMTVGQAIAHGAQRVPAYLAATLLWVAPFVIAAVLMIRSLGPDVENPSPAAALGVVVLIMVVTFFAVRLLLSSSVASNEPVGPLVILRRSWDLTRGHWWRLFVFFMLFLIAAMIAVLAIGAVGGIIAKLIFGATEPSTVGGLVVALLTQTISAAVSVLLMVMLARIYRQLVGKDSVEASVPTSGS
ncbi:MAG: glycerophosphoryl diester phosphodiesterase membrane domain-containing protein [Sphingomicrobium sp.]